MASTLGLLAAARGTGLDGELDSDYCLVHDSLLTRDNNGSPVIALGGSLLLPSTSSSGDVSSSLLLATRYNLSCVYLEAATHEGFLFAQTSTHLFQDRILAKHLPIKTGECLAIDLEHPSREHIFSVLSAEPFGNGYVDENTLFCVAAPKPSAFSAPSRNAVLTDLPWEVDEQFISATMPLKGGSRLDNQAHPTPKPHMTSPAVPLDEAGTALSPRAEIYASPQILNSLGLFLDDWVLLSAPSGDGLHLVRGRIWPHEELVGVPSLLLRNVDPAAGHIDGRTALIGLSATPFGDGDPPIPIAQTLVLSRIASPGSLDPFLQRICLDTIGKNLEESKMIAKEGDFFCAKISTDRARTLLDQGNQNSGSVESSEPDQFLRFPDSHVVPMHFQVTHISHQSNWSHDALRDTTDQASLLTMLGEAGCLIDIGLNQVVQLGMENKSVPGVRSDEFFAGHSTASRLFRLLSSYLGTLQHGFLPSPSFVIREHLSDSAGADLVRRLAEALGLHFVEVDIHDMVDDAFAGRGRMQQLFARAARCAPCVLLLRRLDFLNALSASSADVDGVIAVLAGCLRDTKLGPAVLAAPVIVLATVKGEGYLPAALAELINQELTLEPMRESERSGILQAEIGQREIGEDVNLKRLALQLAAFSHSDLKALVRDCDILATEHVLADHNNFVGSIEYFSVRLSSNFLNEAIRRGRADYFYRVGAPIIPSVPWEDVGGLQETKADILDTIQLPLEHPEFYVKGLRARSGILLYGPPGTGKTMMAKAVATSMSLNFFSVKGPELLNMYIGESEANVRRIFRKARDAEPCVLFFDELDSVAPSRGMQGDSGGVMDRIVSQLLAELDGIMSSNAHVFVMGATNRPDLLDPALLRPGRFDRAIYLGVCGDHDSQSQVIRALTRRFPLERGIDIEMLATLCPLSYTGADFYALCSDAMLAGMSRAVDLVNFRVSALNSSHPGHPYPNPITVEYYLSEMARDVDILITVKEEDFRIALSALIPSISRAEMTHYETVRRQFENRKF